MSIRLPARRRTLALVPMLACTLLSAGLTGQAAAAPPPNYSLAVSTQPDRSSAQPLSGKSYAQSANIHVFTTPAKETRRVRFYLDDTSMGRTPRYIDSAAPFDFAGTASDGTAVALDLSTLSATTHTITAAVETTRGKTRVVSASFTVTAAAPAPPPPPPVETDTTKPTAPVLSATPGDGTAALSWTAATDNVGVTRYEVWHGSTWVAGLGESARSYNVTGLTAGATYDFRVVAHDAAGNYANSNVVAVTASTTRTTTTPPSGSPGPFPSVLRASGRSIVDENGYVLPVLRGFNMHVSPGFTWDQSHFDAIAALGMKVNRAVVVWDQFEPTRGVISSTALANLDLHIARAQAAGIYTMLELHLNVGKIPSWVPSGTGETEAYGTYGQALTQALAYRYGNPSSPKYTKAVIGFGLNEPPIEDSTIRNGNTAIPWIESKQRQMISWMRTPGHAPNWIGFVAYAYASATPIHNDAKQNPNAADASPTAYDSVGGNVVIDVHDYMSGCTNTDPNCDGRQWNGNIYPTWQGGQMISTQGGGSYTSSSLYRSQQNAYLAAYKTFSTQAGIPLMLGEWGWHDGTTGESQWIADKRAAWANTGTAFEIQWNYGVATSQGVWVARPGMTWRSSITAWAGAV